MQVEQFSTANISEYKYEKVTLRNGNGDTVFLDKRRTYQLNDVTTHGWLTAPFGLSDPFGDSSKRQLAILLTDVDLIQKFQALDEQNKNAAASGKWFKGKKEVNYYPLLRTLEDGRILLNAKITPISGKKPTAVWRGVNGSDGLAFERGTLDDITREATYAVRFNLWGMWIQPGNKCGMIANIDELLVMPAAEDMQTNAPTMSIPGMAVTAAAAAGADDVAMEEIAATA